MRRSFYLLSIIFLTACSVKKVDLVVHHATIYTVDSAFSVAEAMAIDDGKIVEVGTNDAILKKYDGDEAINAEGKAIYPGFIDAHAHFVGYGRSLFQVNLFGCNSWSEVLQRVKQFADEHPEEQWIRGRGWDQNKFPGKQFPNNDSLNILFPGKPVILGRVDGHAAIANAKALEMAGVKPGQTLVGGEIETKDGKLTGVLIDNAESLVDAVIPKPTKADYEKGLLAA